MPPRARPAHATPARCALALACALFVSLTAAAQPATQDALQQQLAATPLRFADWDNPALYALLQQNNFPRVPANDTDAAWPPPVDWQALADRAPALRGRPFRIDARFLAAETVTPARPAITHDQPVQQWAVQFAESDDDVAIVILPAHTHGYTAPPADADAAPRRIPLRYARVTIPARFLGHWETRDRDGQPFAFPVFVAQDAAVYDQPAANTNAPAAMLAAAGVLAAIAIALWIKLRTKPWTPRTHQRALDHPQAARGLASHTDHPTHLSDDPAQALHQLRDPD
ncbi:MAG: hypothetical protein AAF823_15115 [Planctomycetota bacterium]